MTEVQEQHLEGMRGEQRGHAVAFRCWQCGLMVRRWFDDYVVAMSFRKMIKLTAKGPTRGFTPPRCDSCYKVGVTSSP